MNNKSILFALAMIVSLPILAQNRGSVKGSLSDTAYRESLADATIAILQAADSSVVTSSKADSKGAFHVKNLSYGTYRLSVSFQGYKTYNKRFTISATLPEVDLGILYMDKVSDMLDEIVVERPPITIKGDTTEFSASAFKTKPNALAEDLLKKLPGVEVDKDGNITAQGEAIQKVFVNGKEFFGNDPKMATRNFTADMIESVQVYDDMSEQAKFTRIDDGSRSKTLNIKLKKGMDTGYFGRGNVGYGTDDRYSASVMLNRFEGNNRLSVTGSSNNVNRQGFNARDIVSSMGGFSGGGGTIRMSGGGGMAGGRAIVAIGGAMGSFGGGGFGGGMSSFGGGGFGGAGSGLTRSTNGGFNYSNLFNKVSLTGSYMYGNTKTKTEQTRLMETRIPSRDSTSFQADTSSSVANNTNHNFNLKLEYELDSMNSFVYTPNVTIQGSDDWKLNNSQVRAVSPGLDYVSLSNNNRSINERNGLSMSNDFLFRHRFKKFGRTFTLGYKNTINNSKGNGYNFSPIIYYDPQGNVIDSRDQDFLSTQTTKSNNNVITSSFTEPIGANKLLEMNYAYTNNSSKSDREGLSYRESTKAYDSINALQTNYFENRFEGHRLGLNFRYKTTLYGFQLGGAVQTSEQNNDGRTISRVDATDSSYSTYQKFINFFPTANFNYDFTRRKNIQLRYQGRTNQPSIRQLQNVIDNSNPLQTYQGNPNLKQEFSNQVTVSYRTFNEANFQYLNFNVNYNQTANKIVNSIDFDPDPTRKGAQLSTPINMNGAFNTSYDLTLGLPLRNRMKGSSINLTNGMRYNRDVSRQYSQNNFTNTFTASQSASINLDYKEKLNMQLKGSFAYNSATYTANQNTASSLNTKYFTQNYSTDINYFILPTLILSTDFDYAINTGRASGFNQNIPLWNGGLAYQIFKKKNGEIKLSVNDILNRNQSIDRRIGENYISDSRTVVLQRYFMLTFTYSFNRFGKAIEQRRSEGSPFPGRPGGMRGGGFPGGPVLMF